MRPIASVTNRVMNLIRTAEICENLQKSAKICKICKNLQNREFTRTNRYFASEWSRKSKKWSGGAPRGGSKKRNVRAPHTVLPHPSRNFCPNGRAFGPFWSFSVEFADFADLQICKICKSYTWPNSYFFPTQKKQTPKNLRKILNPRYFKKSQKTIPKTRKSAPKSIGPPPGITFN